MIDNRSGALRQCNCGARAGHIGAQSGNKDLCCSRRSAWPASAIAASSVVGFPKIQAPSITNFLVTRK